MKIVAVSDIHGYKSARRFLGIIVDTLRPDLLIICGDITTFGPASYAESLLSGLDIRCAAVPGNCDPDEVLSIIESNCVSLHCRREVIDDQDFVGIGGAPICSHSTPNEMSEEDIAAALAPLLTENCVLVTHAPPMGVNDLTASGRHLGSSSIAQLVERTPPRLVLSGHVHEARGIVERGNTVFANPGPLGEGFVVLVEINGKTNARLVDLSAVLENI